MFGTKGADGDDMTEMIDNFTFAPKRTFTVADAVRAAPGAAGAYFSMHFGKCEGRFAVVLHARSHTPCCVHSGLTKVDALD